MIKANELRVGNIISVTGIEFVLNQQTLAYILEQDGIDTRCEPIPLTPERLEKSGFKSYNTISGRDWHMGNIILSEENGGYELFGSEWTIGKTFYYLHQLQNICLDLFGEELEIKLENKNR